jgi:ferredoxin-thioredoxin reductase catalytic chain
MNYDDEIRIDEVCERLNREADEGGYHLNPDHEFTRELVRGILANEARYGYGACPCRLASGTKMKDLDIICPCDYRDPDLEEFDACYCALYVSPDILSGKKQVQSIPERRPPGGPTAHKDEHREGGHAEEYEQVNIKGLPFPVWRCKVCGYLCARPQPPQTCPICKVPKDRFERFM